MDPTLYSLILNRGMPQGGGAPIAPPGQGGGSVLAALLSRLIMRKPNPPMNSSPSVFDAHGAIGQHNQQLQQSLDY